jgi:dTDP-4-amino-4,6-dideoxygalactose transaminase
MEGMKAQGIQTSIHYPPVHRFQIYEKDWLDKGASLPITEDVVSREVTLPLYPIMKDVQVEWAVRAAQQVLKEMQQ